MALGTNTKGYETPNHPYQGERIAGEHDLVDRYGLGNKQELWRAQSELRGLRREARNLLGRQAQGELEPGAEEEQQFLRRLRRLGVLGDEDGLDAVLSLEVEDLLERRLQTVVYREGLANTIDQARQFIVHGHIVVGDRRVEIPSYTVEVDRETGIGFDETSPLADELHPERAEGQ